MTIGKTYSSQRNTSERTEVLRKWKINLNEPFQECTTKSQSQSKPVQSVTPTNTNVTRIPSEFHQGQLQGKQWRERTWIFFLLTSIVFYL